MLLSKPQKVSNPAVTGIWCCKRGTGSKAVNHGISEFEVGAGDSPTGKRRPGTQNRRLCEDSGSLSGNQFTECYRRYAPSKP